MTASPTLDEHVCFALYAASRATTAVYRPLLDDLGLTYPQYLVMLALWETDGISVGDLGSRLELDSGTLSPLLKRMEASNLVTRARARDDERRVEVHLTEHGRALRADARPVPGCIATAGGLDESELITLMTLLRKTTASLRSHAEQ